MDSPYASVEWDDVRHLHSVNHEHTHRAAPGEEAWEESPNAQERFDGLYERGIRHFAISNYHPAAPTYPLGEHFDDVPEDAIGCPNGEHTSGDRGHYCAVASTFTSINRSYNPLWTELFDELLDHLAYEDGGGIIVNHPRRSNLDTGTIEERLDYDPRVLGIEVWNHRGVVNPKYRSRGNARSTWDELLMGGRRVFGYFNPDYHSHWDGRSWGYEARGRNVLLVPETTEEAAAAAYREGRCYGALDGSGLAFERIEATDETVVVETNHADSIEFVSYGQAIHTAYDRQASYALRGDEPYVRVEASDETGEVIFSQPVRYDD